mmetsp:Transcript_42773/g.121981  ORF Transcript_42773/g.121981 Transcript_42773/m.121981 type:complete len:338 (+) Transcript_42773:326-1339(+)
MEPTEGHKAPSAGPSATVPHRRVSLKDTAPAGAIAPTSPPIAASPSASGVLPPALRDSLRHKHLWQSMQLAPFRHPVFLLPYLHALPQVSGWPCVPTDIAAPESGSCSLLKRSRRHWHWWQSGHAAPLLHPPFRRTYLQAVPQELGWPTEPMEEACRPSAPAGCGRPGGGSMAGAAPHRAPTSAGAALALARPSCRASLCCSSSSLLCNSVTIPPGRTSWGGVSAPAGRLMASPSQVITLGGSGVLAAEPSSPARASATCKSSRNALVEWRCHAHRWQRTHRRPSLHPVSLPLYLQAWLQKFGCPMEPTEGHSAAPLLSIKLVHTRSGTFTWLDMAA